MIDKNILRTACRSLKMRSEKQLKEIEDILDGLREMEQMMINSKPPISYESAVYYESGIEELRNDFIAMQKYHRWAIRDMEQLSK